MEDTSRAGLRAELALLEAQEQQLSAKRRHLHNQIDFGYGDEETKARERQISDERQRLHGRIDEIQKLLALPERV